MTRAMSGNAQTHPYSNHREWKRQQTLEGSRDPSLRETTRRTSVQRRQLGLPGPPDRNREICAVRGLVWVCPVVSGSIQREDRVRFVVVGGSTVRWHIPERDIGSNDLDVLRECADPKRATRFSELASATAEMPRRCLLRSGSRCSHERARDLRDHIARSSSLDRGPRRAPCRLIILRAKTRGREVGVSRCASEELEELRARTKVR